MCQYGVATDCLTHPQIGSVVRTEVTVIRTEAALSVSVMATLCLTMAHVFQGNRQELREHAVRTQEGMEDLREKMESLPQVRTEPNRS